MQPAAAQVLESEAFALHRFLQSGALPHVSALITSTTIGTSDAGKAALAESMRADPTIWAVGEDLGRGGVFGQYMGLEDEFGPERIVSAPISEAAIMGSAVGGALTGTRPVVELRFADFALCAVDEMVNQAAKARYMFGGQAKVPVVIRQPSGMWRSSAAQHSQMLEAWSSEGHSVLTSRTFEPTGPDGQPDELGGVLAHPWPQWEEHSNTARIYACARVQCKAMRQGTRTCAVTSPVICQIIAS